jgi:hypothetical protein
MSPVDNPLPSGFAAELALPFKRQDGFDPADAVRSGAAAGVADGARRGVNVAELLPSIGPKTSFGMRYASKGHWWPCCLSSGWR